MTKTTQNPAPRRSSFNPFGANAAPYAMAVMARALSKIGNKYEAHKQTQLRIRLAEANANKPKD